jgi:sugar O-acyltransferase (sialic acid O-acetyltransferase NeuD family)
MSKKLIIFPYNGNGLEALDAVGEAYEFIGFVDDTPSKQGKQVQGFEVFSRELIHRYPEAYLVALPGSPDSYLQRRQVIASLHIPLERFASLVHPKATLSRYATIGYNTVLMAGAVVTSNARIGDHVCVLPNSVIHHDTLIGHYTLVGSQVVIAGHTIIGENCYIGSGSQLIQHIQVGEGALIGLGSSVLRDVPPYAKMVGNPARNLNQL